MLRNTNNQQPSNNLNNLSDSDYLHSLAVYGKVEYKDSIWDTLLEGLCAVFVFGFPFGLLYLLRYLFL